MQKIGKYFLQNDDKVERAINGTVGSEGSLKGGVGSEAADAEILAEYDRLGGLILFGKHKVKTGGFWNFKQRCAIDKPKPVLLFNVNGEIVEVPVGKELPLEVQAAVLADEKKAKKAAKKAAAKKKKGGKKKDEDETEDDESDEEDTDDEDSDDEEGELA